MVARRTQQYMEFDGEFFQSSFVGNHATRDNLVYLKMVFSKRLLTDWAKELAERLRKAPLLLL